DLRLRERGPGRSAELQGQRHSDERLRVSLVLRGVPQAGLSEIRSSRQGEEALPSPRGRVSDHLQEGQVEPDLWIEGEAAAIRAGGSPTAPQRDPQAEGEGGHRAPAYLNA